MTHARRTALVLLGGHLAAFVVVLVREASGRPDRTGMLLACGYGVFVLGASITFALRCRARQREASVLTLAPLDESGSTREIDAWIDPAALERLAGRIQRLRADRDRLTEVMMQLSESIRPAPSSATPALTWHLEPVWEDTSEDAAPELSGSAAVEESAKPAPKPDAMVLLQLEPVRAAGPTEGATPDRVVFGSRGRLASRARVMLQKLGNRLRRDTGASEG